MSSTGSVRRPGSAGPAPSSRSTAALPSSAAGTATDVSEGASKLLYESGAWSGGEQRLVRLFAADMSQGQRRCAESWLRPAARSRPMARVAAQLHGPTSTQHRRDLGPAAWGVPLLDPQPDLARSLGERPVGGLCTVAQDLCWFGADQVEPDEPFDRTRLGPRIPGASSRRRSTAGSATAAVNTSMSRYPVREPNGSIEIHTSSPRAGQVGPLVNRRARRPSPGVPRTGAVRPG